jgi:hypothetical protein
MGGSLTPLPNVSELVSEVTPGFPAVSEVDVWSDGERIRLQRPRRKIRGVVPMQPRVAGPRHDRLSR